MKPQKLLKYLLLLVVAVNLTIVAYVFLGSRPPMPPPLPDPNGYDDFVQAANVLIFHAIDLSLLDHEQLSAFIATNAVALQKVRTGLTRESRVPIEFTRNFWDSHLNISGGIRRLAMVLDAEGRLAELEQRTNDAVRINLEIVRFGQAANRGGLLTDQLLDLACENIALRHLPVMVGSLDATTCRAAIKALTEVDEKREPIAQTIERNRIYILRTWTLGHQIGAMVYARSLTPLKRPGEKTEAHIFTTRNLTRQLMLQLAVHAFTLDKGAPPKSITDLVPAYLQAIPQDAFTGTNLVYSP